MKITHQYQLNTLKNSTDTVILDNQLSQGFNNATVKGTTEHIDIKEIQPILSGNDFIAKIERMRTK